jgi:hypothetical protein
MSQNWSESAELAVAYEREICAGGGITSLSLTVFIFGVQNRDFQPPNLFLLHF